MCAIGTGEEIEYSVEETFEIIMAKYSPKWRADTNPQTQEGQRTPSDIDTNTLPKIPRHTKFKLQKNKGKEKILAGAGGSQREKQ